jgi:hypothetical protein
MRHHLYARLAEKTINYLLSLNPCTLFQSSVDNIVPGALTIQILSGQFLTDKRVGTYVEVCTF